MGVREYWSIVSEVQQFREVMNSTQLVVWRLQGTVTKVDDVESPGGGA